MSQVQVTSVLLVRLLSTSFLKLSVKSKARSCTDMFIKYTYVGKHKPQADGVLIFDEVKGSLPVDMEL